MLKREIKYTNFNDEETTSIAYFHLSKTEMIRMEADYPGGLGGMIAGIGDRDDKPKALAFFEKLILGSYGEKSDDGKEFRKSEELSHRFSQTAAYDALFDELTSDLDVALTFIKSVFPKQIKEQIETLERAEESAKQDSSAPTSATP